ncbi:MAG: RNA polymerase sigma-70 factor [Bacteroidota bacterium]|nr:RNA polymerase sigma-70 factor [Bacteroidota bacterium]
MYSDDQLLKQMAYDDKQAFAMLYRRYWEVLFVTATKALRGKEQAADVVQDIFLSLWNRRNELHLEGSLAAYLHTSVRYKCIHYIEKNITRRDYLVQLAEVAINSFSPNAEINLQLKEIQQTVSSAVAKMPPKMQEVYKLSRQEHLSHNEIAEYMNISGETVKKHIQHALHLIRTALLPHTFTIIILLCSFLC